MPNRLPPLPSLRDIIRIYNLTALRSLSQNFLLDMNLCNKIVKQLGRLDNSFVCEVGPGPGGLTRAILGRNPKELLLVEKDRRFLPILDELRQCYNPESVHVLHGDVLTADCPRFVSGEYKTAGWSQPQRCLKIVGNLPFSISNPLLVKYLREMCDGTGLFNFGRVPLVLTFQNEVAQRIVADAFSPMRCRLSVMSQIFADCTLRFVIPGRAFVPAPDVDVGVVKIVPKILPLVNGLSFDFIERFMRILFNQRSKFCRNSLMSLYPKDLAKDFANELLSATNVDYRLASFELTNDQIRDLLYAYQGQCKENPGLINYDHRHPGRPLPAPVDVDLQSNLQIV